MLRLMLIVTALIAPLSLSAQERIVIAGGSIAEVVYALGAGSDVIAVDQTTSYPPETASLPQIGYWKQLSSEGILALKPTLFLTQRCGTGSCSQPAVIDRRKSTGLTPYSRDG